MTMSALGPYRALDLTDEKGMACGKFLADLGADVIKIENPGGDPAREIGPFYGDVLDRERSLLWWAFNSSKRGVTLDIETPEGRDILKQLAKTADVVIESFPPNYLERIGLGYSVLSQFNPSIILTSITPFGQSGPYRDFQACDLVSMAMGGLMYIAGDEDRPPVRVSVPQAYVHAGAHAAVGTLVALFYRHSSGQGQHVDVSIQEAVVRNLLVEPVSWAYSRVLTRRQGPWRLRGTVRRRDVWDCKDGQLGFTLLTGRYGRGLETLVHWMEEESMAGKLSEVDWKTIDLYRMDSVEDMEGVFGTFFLQRTKRELRDEALRRRILLLPSQTPSEILEDAQLTARGFWVRVEHPELKATLTYPGAPCILSETPWRISRRAPLIGEHNQEVLAPLGFADSERQQTKGSATPSSGSQASASQTGGEAETVRQALSGVKVLDFTWQLAGPFTTKYLADFGALVVKVETEDAIDIMRMSAPYKDNVPNPNRAYGFIGTSGSKYSLALNVRTPKGLDIAKRLVLWADVLVENFSPGIMEKLGLSYQEVKKLNPGIIMASLSGLGQTGPYHRHPAFGWHLVALAGFLHFTGWPDRGGVAPNPAYTDFTTPPVAALAILAALDYRRRTGKGQYIDFSQYEAALSFLATALLDYTANGRENSRSGNTCPQAVPHNAFPCRGYDRWCVIAVHSEEEWQAFRQVIGQHQWAVDARFATLVGRKENEAEIDSLVAGWTLMHTAEEVMTLMQAAGVPAGMVESCQDLLENDPQMAHRRFFEVLEHPEMGRVIHYGWPTKLSKTPYLLRTAPCLGEHSYFVLHDILGMPDDELANLLAESPESFR